MAIAEPQQMSTQRPPLDLAAVEKAVIQGDLSKLSEADRLAYYRTVCESLGVNPATQPFEYITLNGKLTLYGTRRLADQLRQIHQVSVTRIERELIEDLYIVTVYARTGDGREDSDVGAVSLGNLRGEAKANAIMKAITKGKRRVTLSICGLGFLDETEVESVKVVEATEQRGTATPSTGDARPSRPQPTKDNLMHFLMNLAAARGKGEDPGTVLKAGEVEIGIGHVKPADLKDIQIAKLIDWAQTQITLVQQSADVETVKEEEMTF